MLTMICGLPNAGKTTYSAQFENALHQDEIGTISRIVSAIEPMDDVIIEGYFGRREERDRVRRAHSGYAKCIFLDISVVSIMLNSYPFNCGYALNNSLASTQSFNL